MLSRTPRAESTSEDVKTRTSVVAQQRAHGWPGGAGCFARVGVSLSVARLAVIAGGVAKSLG